MTDFIRFFAATDHSPVSELAWAFMRRMMRIRPVRVISLSGGMAGRWNGYNALLVTPQVGTFVNVVCSDPGRWTWITRAAAPRTQLTGAELAGGAEAETETITERAELWTEGVRNVLIARDAPRSAAELATAGKYDVIIVPDLQTGSKFAHAGLKTWVCVHPYHPYPEDTVRNLVLGDV